jgi:hypothetical protein
MSLDGNTSLTTMTTLPPSSSYISLNFCPVGTLPTVPQGTLYLSLQSCSLLSIAMDAVTTQLASYALISGTLDLRGNGIPSAVSQGNIAQLDSAGWKVFND